MREGHLLLGTAALDQGDPVAARAHLEQSLALAAAPPPAIALSAAGLYPQIESLAKLMRVLWLLGYADQAQQRGQEALALARHIGHPPSVVYAAYFVATLAQCRREVGATLAQADAVMGTGHAGGRGRRRSADLRGVGSVRTWRGTPTSAPRYAGRGVWPGRTAR